MQLNWLMRYQPVVRLLDQFQPGTVLDVGSGWHGLSSYRPGLVVQTDLAYRTSQPLEPRPGTAMYVASTAQSLPFSDRAFDYAVSLDMFEHLPGGIREASVRELCRVARRAVLVGFPVGRPAKVVDETLHGLIRLRRGREPDWLTEHRAQHAYPDRRMLTRALPDGWLLAREIKSGNVVSQTAVVLAEHLPGIQQGTLALERRWRGRGVPSIFDRGLSYRTIFVVLPVGR